MSNPNALYYQQMVTSPNAYWLNFFLKRDINVVCWNYRGYGESEVSRFECVTPYKEKRDIERVLAFVVNNIRVKGKLGVYGRSIGGITATHLAAKYPDLIQTLIIDRSFDELQSVPEGRCKGGCTSVIFKLFSFGLRTLGVEKYIEAKQCYKIINYDPMDDTVDEFGNLANGVAKKLAKQDYTQGKYIKFYDSLLYVYKKESQLFEALKKEDKDDLNTVILSKIEYIERQINGSQQHTEITEELS